MKRQIKESLQVLALLAGAVLAVNVIVHLVFDFDEKSAPTQTTVSARQWGVEDSHTYALQKVQDFADREYSCLKYLWGKESAWNPKAINHERVGGLKAGGIPQLLGMSTKLTPAKQIDRGLKYIYHRYDTPCNAWSHWKKKGWY